MENLSRLIGACVVKSIHFSISIFVHTYYMDISESIIHYMNILGILIVDSEFLESMDYHNVVIIINVIKISVRLVIRVDDLLLAMLCYRIFR